MSIQDRNERYAKVRAWLDYPYAHAPRPHQILSQMLIDEQALNLQLTNEGESWNLTETKLTTVVGLTEYVFPGLTGKIYFAVRSTGNPDAPYLPVGFDDLSELDYGKMPLAVNDTLRVPEKISVYRTGMQDQSMVVVFQPTPVAVLDYRLWFYTGQMDRLYAAMDKSMLVSELTDYIDLKSAIALLPYCRWFDDDVRNDRKADKLAKGLTFQFGELKPTVLDYIDNVNADTDFSLGHWNDRDI